MQKTYQPIITNKYQQDKSLFLFIHYKFVKKYDINKLINQLIK